ncbi:MAG: hypothetical protein E7K32_14485 [Bacteroides stercoris]|nr:hypothetical protein [Bacteroides stercoris]
MAFTEEEKQEILEVVKAESKSVESLETVGSLSGVKSLPGQKGDKLVSVPINLLTKSADDAAARAIEAAERAEELAPEMETAIQETETAIQTAGESAKKAEAAAKKAEDTIAQGYKHEEMTEEDFESLPEKDGKTIYLIYEEEQA